MSQATILSYPQVTPLDLRLARLTDFLGIDCDIRAMTESSMSAQLASALLAHDHHCLMLSATTLGSLLERDVRHGDFLPRLLDRTRYLFVYGFRPAAADISAVRQLSRGLIDSVMPLPPNNRQYAISSDWRSLTREFTGLAFGPAQPAIDSVFSGPHPLPALRPIISIGGCPSFASFTRGACNIFVLACSDIADLEVAVTGELRVVDWFSRVIPATMFIQHAFGRRSWHNPRPTATFIIDDPLLKESHGFLNYRQLLRAMSGQPFAATIAFIPFNFRRSEASVIELFRGRPDRLSLCIHGCNHTGGEFATTNLSVLNAMSRLAADRMRAHEKATALAYGKIMVFPQGRFSAAALKALRCNGYTAAVNTGPMPDGSGPNDHLSLREWLDVAVTRYHGFPLFVRRYPGGLVNFAFDLFLGKPVLVVEHHTAFRQGYGGVAGFVAELNSLNAALRWGSLQETLGHATLQRHLSNETVSVRVWSNRSILCNGDDRPRTYSVVKQEAADAAIQYVAVDGHPVEYVLDKGLLKMSLSVEPLASRIVEIGYANDLPSGENKTNFRSALAVHARRRLSELRDELLYRQQQLRKLGGVRILGGFGW